MSLGHGSLILLSLSVFFLLFIIRHDNVLSGLFKKSLFGGISESQALGVFVILTSSPRLLISASAVINSSSL